MPSRPLVAVDIGNARIKLGLFQACCAEGLPEPEWTLALSGDAPDLDPIAAWLPTGSEAGALYASCDWCIASVSRPAMTRLTNWLRTHRPDDRVTLLAARDLPLEVRLDEPEKVGIDRLVDAVAANRLREPGRPVVLVDVGSAITVDLVSADGAFCGGAILPGIQMSARAMHEFTDLLPLVDVLDLAAPPPALGASTVPAMQSGLFWGAVGGIRQLIEEFSKGASVCGKGDRSNLCEAPSGPFRQIGPVPFSTPHVFLTGGAGVAVAELLGDYAQYVPNLTLAGIALAAWHLAALQESPRNV